MVRLWSFHRRSDMGAPGHLPSAGGAGDQAAAMLDAFQAMDAAAAELRQRDEDGSSGGRSGGAGPGSRR